MEKVIDRSAKTSTLAQKSLIFFLLQIRVCQLTHLMILGLNSIETAARGMKKVLQQSRSSSRIIIILYEKKLWSRAQSQIQLCIFLSFLISRFYLDFILISSKFCPGKIRKNGVFKKISVQKMQFQFLVFSNSYFKNTLPNCGKA